VIKMPETSEVPLAIEMIRPPDFFRHTGEAFPAGATAFSGT
jgi:hypothetical protein